VVNVTIVNIKLTAYNGAVMKTQPAPRRTYHHGALKSALILEAAKLVERRKDVTFTIRDLAARLGVSHSAAYRHFRDKRTILAAVAEQGFRLLHLRLAEAEQGREARPGECLREKGIVYVMFALENPGYFRAMFHSELSDKSQYPTLQQAAHAAFQSLATTIDARRSLQPLAGGSTEQLSIKAWAQVHGLACLLVDGQLPQLAQARGRRKEERARLAQAIGEILAS
jgi:AcrR family transcriptional regulator